MQWVTPCTASGCGPGAAAAAVPPRGRFTTRTCVRQEGLPARPFLHFPGKARLWERRAGGGSWLPAPSGTGTLGNLFCASASVWGGLRPGMGRAPLPLVGLLLLHGAPGGDAGLAAAGEAWDPAPERGEERYAPPRPPASSCAGRRRTRGRKCRALTPRFHRGDGRPSSVLRGSILLQTAALAPRCSPARRGGCGHTGCHTAPAHRPAG